jgi:hypothetical protein
MDSPSSSKSHCSVGPTSPGSAVLLYAVGAQETETRAGPLPPTPPRPGLLRPAPVLRPLGSEKRLPGPRGAGAGARPGFQGNRVSLCLCANVSAGPGVNRWRFLPVSPPALSPDPATSRLPHLPGGKPPARVRLESLRPREDGELALHFLTFFVFRSSTNFSH